jgi:hypothetical protein
MSAVKTIELVSIDDYLAGELDSPIKHEYQGLRLYDGRHERTTTSAPTSWEPCTDCSQKCAVQLGYEDPCSSAVKFGSTIWMHPLSASRIRRKTLFKIGRSSC